MDSPLLLDPASVVLDRIGYSSDHNYSYLSAISNVPHSTIYHRQLLSSHSKLIEAELWAYGHVWKSDVLFYGTMWEGPNYTRARPLGS